MRARRQGEGALSDAIRDALALESGLLLFRNSQAVMRKGPRVYRGGLGNGSADLVGVLRVCVGHVATMPTCVGRFIALEVKSPGEIPTVEDLARIHAKPVQKRTAVESRVVAQWAWLVELRSRDAFATYVDSVESARAAIARARRGANQ
jgi:hypothetical protein